MTRLPIRLRLTLVFAVVMAVVLGAVGLFLYLRLEAQLNENIDVNLRSRAGEVSALVRGAGGGLSAQGSGSLIEQEESFSQILTVDGQIVDSTPQLRARAVLSAAELERAASTPTFFERDQLPGLEGSVRLLAAPVQTQRQELIAIVGSSLDDRDEALRNLAVLLLIGGPVALLLAALAGYWVARAALRPVEGMRERAAAISATEPNERLPVPPAGDELSRLGETLNEMLGRLEGALERERRFVDDASHELRTPLALHKAELEVALRYEAGSDELRAAVVSAIEEVDRLIQLAEDLLVVARSEAGKLAVNLEPLSIADLFGTVRERFGARAGQANRELVTDAGEGLRVEGDRLRLEQALTNMVDNALRYGEGDVRLWAKPNARGDRVGLHVSDRGQGFSPEFVERAFERFSRADSARSRGGSGLGLAIVETIARAHGGRAGAANDAGGGADVWIEIPASSA